MNDEPKRPRGRPRKPITDPEPPKRPRGRPLKELPDDTKLDKELFGSAYRHWLATLRASRSYYERNRVEIAKRRKEQREAEKLSGEVAVAENE